MKRFKVALAMVFFITSITFDEQVLKTSENILISKWSVSFGVQTSHAVALYQDFISVNFE